MNASRTTCLDCGTALKPIKLIDATSRELGKGACRVNLTYAAEDAVAPLGGWIGGGIAPEGNVYGRLCPQCGRILLYAVPTES